MDFKFDRSDKGRGKVADVRDGGTRDGMASNDQGHNIFCKWARLFSFP